jgi:hypothetical protein
VRPRVASLPSRASYRRGHGTHGRLRRVSHPSLGLPPRDLKAGDPVAADALRRAGPRLHARALQAAIDIDPTLKDRHSELTRQMLLADLQAFVERLIVALASGQPRAMATFADLVAVRYRKRKIAMDDVVTLCEGLRRAAAAVVDATSLELLDQSIDEGIAVFRWHRRLAGDARKRNPILSFIYKGA